ncbi:hypothetical protein N0V90_012678 [Kalmusia sp. IMI 367209]|nr:hypothetical protein N0V90_012678 [Kalmusia sp. IMI 367209]
MQLREPIALPERVLLSQLASFMAQPNETPAPSASTRNDSVLMVQNRSYADQQFVVFAEKPEFTSGQYPDKIFTTVYQASLKVASSSGSATFVLADCSIPTSDEYSRRIYVMTGHAHTKLGDGVTLYPNDTKVLKLSTETRSTQSSCTVTIPAESAPRFLKNEVEKPPQLSDGEVQIKVDTSFRYPDAGYPFVGLGVPNPFDRDVIIPITAWEAIPGTNYILRPSSIWKCVRGKKAVREIIDPNAWSEFATINLTKPKMEKMVTFRADGTFTDNQ